MISSTASSLFKCLLKKVLIPAITLIILSLSTPSQFSWYEIYGQTGDSAAVVGENNKSGIISGARPAEKNSKKLENKDAEKFIYIPYRELNKAYERVHSSVIVNYQEYLELWKKQYLENKASTPPVNATYLSADYQVQVIDDLASIEGVIKIRSLIKGWTTIPLDFGTAAIGTWSANQDKVILQGNGQGKYQLLLPDAGDYELNIKLGAAIHSSLDGREFEWNCPAVSISTLTVTVPKSDQNIEIFPKGVPVKETGEIKVDKSISHIKAHLSSTDKIKIRFAPKQSSKPEMELLTSVTNHTRLMFRDGMIHTDCYLKYDVLRGKLDSVTVAVPLGQRILDVTAETRIKSWKATQEPTRQVISIEFLAPVTQSQKIEIHTETAIGKDAIDTIGLGQEKETWGIHALDVVRENGQLILKSHQDLELAIITQQGVVRIDQNEVVQTLRDSQAISFKYYSPQVRLAVKVQAVEPKVEVEHDTSITIQEDDIKQNSVLNYLVEKAGIFELKIKLPEGYKVSQVLCPSMKENRVDEAIRTLIVTLKDKTTGQIKITILGHLPIAKDQREQEFNLPLLEPVDVLRETGRIHLFAKESIEIITNEASLKGVNPVPPTITNAQQDRTRVVASWLFTRRPVIVPVKTLRKPTRINAEVGTKVYLKTDVVEVNTKLNYQVDYAGIDTFKFQVPAAYSSRLQITVLSNEANVNIKQKHPDEEAKAGWVTWTVIMQRELMGNVGFNISYDIPVTQGEKQEANTDTMKKYQSMIEPIKPLGLEKSEIHPEAIPLSNIDGEISLDKENILSVQSKSLSEDAEAIDIRELEILEIAGFQAYRYSVTSSSKPVIIEVEVKRQEIQEVIKTVISRELIEAVIGQDDRINYRARFLVKTSERQRLPLLLPQGAEPFMVMVGQRQVQLEKSTDIQQQGYDPYYISVSRPESSDEQFLVTTQFSLKQQQDPFGSLTRSLTIALPLLGGVATAVQQERAVIYIPEHFAFIGKPELFTVESSPLTSVVRGVYGKGQVNMTECQNWIGQTTTLLDFPTEGRSYAYLNLGGTKEITLRAWNFTNVTIALSLFIAVMALVLMKIHVETKLTYLILSGLAVLLLAQVDQDMVQHGLLAGRFGILALGFIWIVHALLPISSRMQQITTKPTETNTTSELPSPS